MADSSSPTPILSEGAFDSELEGLVAGQPEMPWHAPYIDGLKKHDRALRDAVAVLTEDRDAARQHNGEREARINALELDLFTAEARVAVLTEERDLLRGEVEGLRTALPELARQRDRIAVLTEERDALAAELAIAQQRGDGWREKYRADTLTISQGLREATELLREAAWLHGILDPPHPYWSSDEHEEREEEWIVDRVHPWLILNHAIGPWGKTEPAQDALPREQSASASADAPGMADSGRDVTHRDHAPARVADWSTSGDTDTLAGERDFSDTARALLGGEPATKEEQT